MKAALLDAPAASGRGVYLRMVELESAAQLTDHHLPQITSCDLPSGEYVWLPDAANSYYGGAFHSLAVLARREELRVEIEKEAARADKLDRLGTKKKRGKK
jgi:hypothetical protein